MESRDSLMTRTDMLNALTIDVEDYFQVSAFEADIRRDEWDSFPSRVEANTNRVLHLLAQHGVRATFFVLGWVANRFPHLVTAIHREGHEIGSHGFWHHLVYNQTPRQFRDDIRASRDELQGILGMQVTAYRAPSFSITRRSLWALEVLVEEGFTIDSSVFPVLHDRYGIPSAQPGIHRIDTPSGSILEFPPSVATLGPLSIPVGGGYFRLYPWPVTQLLLHRVQHHHDRPVLFYQHPWEIDVDQPCLKAGTWCSRWRHYINLKRTEKKLHALLRRYAFAPISEVLERSIGHTTKSRVDSTQGHSANAVVERVTQ